MEKTNKASTQAAALEGLVNAVNRLLSKPQVNAATIQRTYDRYFGKDEFYTSVMMSRPHFNEDVYPRLPVNILGILKSAKKIPTWGSAKDLLAIAMEDDSLLARILATYIWKRGELSRVRYVRDGLLAAIATPKSSIRAPVADSAGAPEDINGPVVMWQFGRHLAGTGHHPIFDQHTYRAFKILRHGVQTPRKLQLRLNHLNEYLDWWGKFATKHLPPPGSADRPAATYALDKLLFSVGKAALLCPTSYPRKNRKKKA